MSAQTDVTTASSQGIPEPPAPGEETHFRRVARPPYRGTRHDVGVTLEVPFDPEQSEWLLREARRADISAIELVQLLVDEARRNGASVAGR